jgi:hypothetical protein
MTLSEDVQTATLRKLRELEVFTLTKLMELLSCSRRTAQRSLAQWKCRTSFNANAKYYALPEVVRFDQHGIWRCGLAIFSADGNLSETLIGVIERSSEGMVATELTEILGVKTNSVLRELARSGRLVREKEGRRFVYFGSGESLINRRKRSRTMRRSMETDLSLTDAIVVLVESIKNPALDPAGLATAVGARAPTASEESIKRFFSMHGLSTAAKKRALRSQP